MNNPACYVIQSKGQSIHVAIASKQKTAKLQPNENDRELQKTIGFEFVYQFQFERICKTLFILLNCLSHILNVIYLTLFICSSFVLHYLQF